MRHIGILTAALLLAPPCLAQSQQPDALAFHLSRSALLPQGEYESKTEHYALVGGGIGAIAGLLVDTARNFAADQPPVCQVNPATTPCTTDQARLSPPFGTSVLIGAGAGLIVGAIVGHQMTPSSSFKVSTSLGHGAVGLVAQAKF